MQTLIGISANQRTCSSPMPLASELGGCPRVAVIGASGYAGILLNTLLPCLQSVQGRVVAATLIGSDAKSDTAHTLIKSGCRIFSDYQEMLHMYEGQLDLCVIPTSIHWHSRMSVAALEAGANVLVEKPLAGSVADALRITEAARQTGRFVAVGFQDMYSPQTHSIKQFLCSGHLGKLRSIHASGSWPREKPYYDRNDWAGRKSKDGWAIQDSPLNNAFAHFLNLALYFSGPDRDTFAQIEKCDGNLLRNYPIETFDTAGIRLLTTQDTVLHCVFTHSDEELSMPKLIIQLEGGVLTWDFEIFAVAVDTHGKEVDRWRIDKSEESRQAMVENVLHCLATGEEPYCSAEDSLAHVKAVESIMTRIDVGMSFPGEPAWGLRKGLFNSLLQS